jgi:hypothetical protein
MDIKFSTEKRTNAYILDEINTLSQYFEKNPEEILLAFGLANSQDQTDENGKPVTAILVNGIGKKERIMGLLVLIFHLSETYRKLFMGALDMYVSTINDEDVQQRVELIRKSFLKGRNDIR